MKRHHATWAALAVGSLFYATGLYATKWYIHKDDKVITAPAENIHSVPKVYPARVANVTKHSRESGNKVTSCTPNGITCGAVLKLDGIIVDYDLVLGL